MSMAWRARQGKNYRYARSRMTDCVALTLLVFGVRQSTAQMLSVSPDVDTVMTFAGFQGGPFLPETPTVWTLDNSESDEFDFTITSDQPWLLVAPSTGTVPGSVVIDRTREAEAIIDSVDAAELAPGVYTAHVEFLNITNGAGSTERLVRLNVAAANFSVSPNFVNASTTTLGTPPSSVLVRLSSNGHADLSYRLSWTSRSWFTVDKTEGTVPGGSSDSFYVAFNSAGLSPGVYTGSIEIENVTNGVGSRDLPVNLIVQQGGAGSVQLLPDQDIEAAGAVGAIPSMKQTSTLTNNSENIVIWNATSSEDWVSITPAGGQLAPINNLPGGPDEQVVEIRVNAGANDLEPGSHSATVSFENLTGGVGGKVNIGSRLVHVVAQPVLRVAVALPGGRVFASPPGQNVAGQTSADMVVDFGEIVTLTVDLEDGYAFQGWAADFHLDSAFENPLVVTMDRNRSVSAIVVPIDRTLTLSSSGTGTGIVKVTPAGSSIDNDLVSSYKGGTQVSITAEADAGSVFVGWAGNVPVGQEQVNPLTIVMDSHRTITARFESFVGLTVDVSAGGSVLTEPDLDQYSPGSTVTLTALPEEGFVFQGWSGAATGIDSTITITLSDDAAIIATFVADDGNDGGGDGGGSEAPKLLVDIQGDGVVTPPGGSYQKGARVTLIATPGVRSAFVRWEGDADGTELLTTVVMEGDRQVRAVFESGDVDGGDGPGRPSPGTSGTCGAVGMLGLPFVVFGLAFVAQTRSRRK